MFFIFLEKLYLESQFTSEKLHIFTVKLLYQSPLFKDLHNSRPTIENFMLIKCAIVASVVDLSSINEYTNPVSRISSSETLGTEIHSRLAIDYGVKDLGVMSFPCISGVLKHCTNNHFPLALKRNRAIFI